MFGDWWGIASPSFLVGVSSTRVGMEGGDLAVRGMAGVRS